MPISSVTIKLSGMSKPKQRFSWKRFWKNFNLASEPIIKLLALAIALVLFLNLSKSKGIVDNPKAVVPIAATIGGVILVVLKKPKSPS